MAQTDAEVLEDYKLARDAILAAISVGDRVVRYRIGNREVYKDATPQSLEFIEKMIRYYSNLVNGASNGRAYNLAKRVRRG